MLSKELIKICMKNIYGIVVSKEHKVYSSNNLMCSKDSRENLVGLVVMPEEYEGLVGLVMVPEENENNFFVLLINNEFEDLVPFDMNSSFSSKISFEGFVVMGVEDDFIDFVAKNFFKDRIFSSGLFNLSFTNSTKNGFISHLLDFKSLKNSSADLYVLPVGSSLNDFFNSSTCSGLGSSSSTGCQSIASQNSQSSSVTSRVSLYLLDMSCFNSLTTALDNNSELNFASLIDTCSILTNYNDNSDYLSFVVDDEIAEQSSVVDENISILDWKGRGSGVEIVGNSEYIGNLYRTGREVILGDVKSLDDKEIKNVCKRFSEGERC